MAPRRPVLFRDQIPLGVLSAVLLLAGVIAVAALLVARG
jgi:hypothetical protein